MLAPRDRITVFDSASSRRAVIDSVLVELKRQAVLGAPSPVVSVAGRVKESGEYPLEADMRVSDLIRASGGLQDSAFSEKAELTRYRVDAGQRVSEILEINLSALLKGDSSADIVLEPFDALVVKEVPEWSQREYVTLRGEVRFPGTYPLRRGETLRSVLERAGGLTTLAFAKGAVFTRRDLIEREQKQIDDLASRLKSDLVSRAVQAGNLMEASGRVPSEGSSAAIADGLLNDLKNSKPTGRLVIDLDGVVSRALGSSRDVILRDGDELSVPKLRQEVTVIGEVQNATSHLFRSSSQRDDYIALSGGATPRADMSRAYIVRADGSVVPQKAGWVRQSKAMLIQPGDTIVVPLDTERLPQLGLWQAVSTIIYNSAVALAAIRNL
jgi:polysaccharide export outer membrane protein